MNKLTIPQSKVLFANTILSIGNGFAAKYHDVIAEDLDSAEEYLEECLPEIEADQSVEYWKNYIKKMGNALMAEAPISFFVTTERECKEKGILAEKVDPFTGETIDGSIVFVGSIGGIAGEGLPFHGGITLEHIKFAYERLVEQEKTGLNFDV